MATNTQKVQVLTVTTAGIRAKIYGKDYSYNAANNSFFIAQDGKWVPATPAALHQTILRDRHSQWLAKEKQKEFMAQNPLYKNSRQRFADATSDFYRSMGV